MLYKHALRNALIPVITLLGLTIPTPARRRRDHRGDLLVAGLGCLAIKAVTTNDYPVILAIVMVGGIMVLLGNLLADVLYGFVDPRIKY